MQNSGDRTRLAVMPSPAVPARFDATAKVRAALPQFLTTSLGRERDGGSAFNLVPVFFGAGILAYFAAPDEPSAVLLNVLAAISLLAALRMQRHGAAFFVLVAIGLVLAGAATAQWRAERIGGSVIPREMTAMISGVVISAEATRRQGTRYLIRPTAIEGMAPATVPRLIRVTAASGRDAVRPGERIAGKARLQPFSGPLIPGGHDFGFSNWFAGLGGTGFFMGRPARMDGPPALQGLEAAAAAINRLRMAITARIRGAIGGEVGDIAAALITGERMAVDKATEESFRRSGLAHILSISGLHMVLVTVTVVWGLRFVLALVPMLAVRQPIRKWASAAGLVSATFYLLLSGAEVPTQRSYIMIAIMLAAMLADRRAISLRNVALAALVVLLLTPEAVLDAGFQMSFAAAAALVATFSALTDRRERRNSAPGHPEPVAGILRSGLAHVGSLALTSIVAGLATGLFAAWHFHRTSPLGLLANLVAMPVASFVTMPLALVSVLLMPFGLETAALIPMGWSIDVVISISDWVSAIPVGDTTGRQPLAMLLLGSAGLVILICLKTGLRFFGIGFLAAALLFARQEAPPDLIIAQSGRTVAMRADNGELVFLGKGKDPFVTEIWSRAWPVRNKDGGQSVNGNCNRDHCIAIGRYGVRVEIVYAPSLLPIACERADILAAPRLRYVNCRGRKPAIVLARGDFEARGTHVVRFPETGSRKEATTDEGYRVEHSIRLDDRPWNQARSEARQNAPVPATRFSSGGSTRPADPVPSRGPG
jgi:competence protein ComEC